MYRRTSGAGARSRSSGEPARDERRLRARVCRADALAMAVVAGCVIFHRRQLLLREPRIPPPSFLLLRAPVARPPSVSFILHSSFAVQPPPVSLLRSGSPCRPLSSLPLALSLRWRTLATYAADTPLDTSCTILDLLISHPECTDTGMHSVQHTIPRGARLQCILRLACATAGVHIHARDVHKGLGPSYARNRSEK